MNIRDDGGPNYAEHILLQRLDLILANLREEVRLAIAKHPPMHSPHEGKSVIEEELDELWDEIKANRGREPSAMSEALQIAAMGVRYILDLEGDPKLPEVLG